jgi:hypothetical protein
MPEIKDFTGDLSKDLTKTDADMLKTALQRAENQIIHTTFGFMLAAIITPICGFWWALFSVLTVVMVVESTQVFLKGNPDEKTIWDVLADITSWLTGVLVYLLITMGFGDSILYSVSGVILWLAIPVTIAGAYSVAYGFQRIE